VSQRWLDAGAEREPSARGPADLVGRGRRRRGEGFAVRRGLWPWALAVACERAANPAGIAVHGGAALTSRWFDGPSGGLHARVAEGPARDATAVVLVHGVIVSSRYLVPAAVKLAADRPIVVPDRRRAPRGALRSRSPAARRARALASPR
jgi:hypothetical protein